MGSRPGWSRPGGLQARWAPGLVALRPVAPGSGYDGDNWLADFVPGPPCRTRRESTSKTAGALLPLIALLLASGAFAQFPPDGPPPAGPAREIAPVDLTGQWVAVISEDWRWRMVTPGSRRLSQHSDESRGPATCRGAWDPTADEAAGEACKAYGAPGLMRGPTRLRIEWLDDNTLRLESDYGMQTRLFHFHGTAPEGVNTDGAPPERADTDRTPSEGVDPGRRTRLTARIRMAHRQMTHRRKAHRRMAQTPGRAYRRPNGSWPAHPASDR